MGLRSNCCTFLYIYYDIKQPPSGETTNKYMIFLEFYLRFSTHRCNYDSLFKTFRNHIQTAFRHQADGTPNVNTTGAMVFCANVAFKYSPMHRAPVTRNILSKFLYASFQLPPFTFQNGRKVWPFHVTRLIVNHNFQIKPHYVISIFEQASPITPDNY